jgi:hypothetical protein
MPRRLSLLSLTLLLYAACASQSGTQASTPRRVRDLISADEISRVQVGTAYDVVQTLRPEYLRSRSTATFSGAQELAVVYIDGVRAGSVDQLRRVPRETLNEIRYVNAADATTRFGTGHAGGAILVATKR